MMNFHQANLIHQPERLAESIRMIRSAGPDHFHVLADFDKTLTPAFADGQKNMTIIAQLRNGQYLTPEYAPQAQALFDHYAPLEKDPNLTLAERKEKMHEWWVTHYQLLVKCGLNKTTITQAIQESKMRFREGIPKFFHFLHQHNIPLVIMSAAPGDMLLAHLVKANLLLSNVYAIGNLYDFDHEGNALKIREPVIHSLNKSEIAIQGFPVYEEIKERKNVLLLGDSLGDIGMIEGFDYHELIKIGFLNENDPAETKLYQENFDIVITNDGTMDPINELLSDLFD